MCFFDRFRSAVAVQAVRRIEDEVGGGSQRRVLAAPLEADAAKAVIALKTEIDEFHVNGRELYWLLEGKQSNSKVSKSRFDKAVRAPITFRGLKMLARLAAKCTG